MELICRVVKRHFENVSAGKKKRDEQADLILDKPDRRIIQRYEKRNLKWYNLSQTAIILKVPRQTLYYWIKKGWVKPKRDYRNYPVFTVFDIGDIMKWRHRVPS